MTKQLLETLQTTYSLGQFQLELPNRSLTITYVDDVDTLLERITPEQFDEDERLPYWADIWPSAYALALYSQHLELEKKNVLELGSGVGMAGVAFASEGAHVVFSDYEDEALKFCTLNAMQNNIDTFSTKNIDWRNPTYNSAFDCIIGADIVYEEQQFIPVIHMLKRYLSVSVNAYIAEPNITLAYGFKTPL